MKLIKCMTKGEVKEIINKYKTTHIIHPNIIRIYEAGHFTNPNGNAHVYVLMELILGNNLDQEIKKMKEEGKLYELPERISMIKQISGAVKVLHDNRRIHCDIKPANIFIKNKR